ncbi:SYF2 splicing factor [Phialemonium atrogriseum]|uniref:Pre-mRNA-splicing factor SYF2 n=1 Tax=Phialemonium atrogriseum TaxID=1093897 RepID=A0AAJ0FI53_9PEZI|nr:SYF2 splicing factor [Phialemonium atrogriseum]KAK1769271.1 SYF2 splicing factor [Phialemonium atrogriseum]
MPPAKKRKTGASKSRATKQADPEQPVEQPTAEAPDEQQEPQQDPPQDPSLESMAIAPPPEPSLSSKDTADTKEDAAAKAKERMARFRALQARAKTSSDQNLKEATKESQRVANDPGQLNALSRKQAIASQKLLKADVEEAGEDFERKRAWDWTVEESERWDKRVRKREAHRDNNAFKDYGAESQKVYKRQVRDSIAAPDLERYTRDKMAAIERAAAAGTLEIVETDDGELIAVDKDGGLYSTADSTAFAESKPDKAAIDRLVNDLKKAEAVSLKKRRDRMAANGDDADVTYINEKNKQFNQKLSRFYNKYTAEIRDSFERGTMV